MSRLFSGTPFDRPSTCPTCRLPKPACRCLNLPPKNKKKTQPGYQLTPQNAAPPKDQLARIRVEKRKGNRLVTLITGLEHPANDLPGVLTNLKTHLGTGGSVQQRTLELQGDHAAALPPLLQAMGITARP